jgi:hypothetical protein
MRAELINKSWFNADEMLENNPHLPITGDI